MRMQVDLPAPLGPRKPTSSPGCDLEADVVHGQDGAVVLGQVLDVDRGRRHVRAARGAWPGNADWTRHDDMTANGADKLVQSGKRRRTEPPHAAARITSTRRCSRAATGSRSMSPGPVPSPTHSTRTCCRRDTSPRSTPTPERGSRSTSPRSPTRTRHATERSRRDPDLCPARAAAAHAPGRVPGRVRGPRLRGRGRGAAGRGGRTGQPGEQGPRRAPAGVRHQVRRATSHRESR